MAAHQYLHIGVFVKCINSIIKVDVTRRRCSNAACCELRVATDEKTCPTCGRETEEFTYTEKKFAVNGSQLAAEMGETLMLIDREGMGKEEVDIFITATAETEVDLSRVERVGFMPINDIGGLIARHFSALEQDYAEELETLRSAYGAENVTVHWGIVSYYE